jgi:phosphoribosylanthranilate isomerase
VCGLTRPADVAAACELGARYVGFNFAAASPRRVGIAAAREISRETAPGVERVGVFVDEARDEILRAAEAAALDLVQIHRPLAAGDLDLPLPLVAWMGVDASGELAGSDLALTSYCVAGCRAVIVDTPRPGGGGGTGRTFDWSALAGRRLPAPLWLAGGLVAENVADAIARVRPSAVDVASGVESAPGIKDRGRLEEFFRAVRRADEKGRENDAASR